MTDEGGDPWRQSSSAEEDVALRGLVIVWRTGSYKDCAPTELIAHAFCHPGWNSMTTTSYEAWPS